MLTIGGGAEGFFPGGGSRILSGGWGTEDPREGGSEGLLGGVGGELLSDPPEGGPKAFWVDRGG